MEFNVASGRIVFGILLVLSIASCDLERTRNARDTQGRSQGRVGTRGPPRFPRGSRPRRPRLQDSVDRLESARNLLLPGLPQTLPQEGYQESLILQEEDEGEGESRGVEDPTRPPCSQGCPSATRNLTLTKEVVLELLQEVAHYLRASELVLVIRREYYGKLVSQKYEITVIGSNIT